MTEVHEIKKKIIPKIVFDKLEELKNIEIVLGHIPPESWTIRELYKKIEEKREELGSDHLETQTEILFTEVCKILDNLKFNESEIANAVNSVVKYERGPKYCNETEVRNALGFNS